MQEWLRSVHRYPQFRERWHAVGATLDGKVAIDVGCGPGNVLQSLGDKPAVAIGVDVTLGSLKLAASKYRWAQRLSGIDPDSNDAALSLMIVARKSG